MPDTDVSPAPRTPCPFCDLAGRDLVASNEFAVAFRDGYAVNPGHPLIVPRRYVATWSEASREEQVASLELADEVKARLVGSTSGARLPRASRGPTQASWGRSASGSGRRWRACGCRSV